MPGPAVLVVEDDSSVQTTLCATLALLGFTPHHADSVHGALLILSREHIDAVTLDIRLADSKGLPRSGISLLAYLRATPDYAHVPVLIFTGIPLSSDDETLVRKHGAHIFYKPQPYSVLVSHLSRLLDRTPAA
jgi:DNA-binding response OmpR family regulator